MISSRSTIIVLALLLTACVSPSQSDLNYISPVEYQADSCAQLSAEARKVSGQIDDYQANAPANEIVNSALATFAQTQGYSYDASANDQTRDELKRLKSRYKAIEDMSVRKNCL